MHYVSKMVKFSITNFEKKNNNLLDHNSDLVMSVGIIIWINS